MRPYEERISQAQRMTDGTNDNGMNTNVLQNDETDQFQGYVVHEIFFFLMQIVSPPSRLVVMESVHESMLLCIHFEVYSSYCTTVRIQYVQLKNTEARMTLGIEAFQRGVVVTHEWKAKII
jgi:hypothetical protein